MLVLFTNRKWRAQHWSAVSETADLLLKSCSRY